VDKKTLTAVTGLTALLIFCNYHFTIDDRISQEDSFIIHFIARYGIFFVAFAVPYLFNTLATRQKYFNHARFIFLLLIAPAIFALKVVLDIPLHFSNNSNWNNYWNHVFYWPLLVMITGGILLMIRNLFNPEQPLYGMRVRNMDWKPYWLMLLIMLPLVAAASTQPDFLAMYPKLKLMAGVYEEEGLRWWHKLIFELSYGSDFITIELFFRGFLILAFIKWAGKDAILPMACFYCTIHFGKPLGECISSYFGGMILGIVVYHTRSILGGLMVHLGIAWMMELGGYIGNSV
jgi:hypothetical protein